MIARRMLLPAAILLAVSGAPVMGAAVVRSGEHPTFSRLVFADEPGRSWSVERTGRRAGIIFSKDAPDLDLATVFDLIPRRRIVRATSDAGRLDLELGCDCVVSVMQIPTGHIVIDVRDPPPDIRADGKTLRREGTVLPLLLPSLDMNMVMFEVGGGDQSLATGPSARAAGGPIQVRRHPAGTLNRLMPKAERSDERTSRAGCPFEDLAREVFESDPHEAFANLPDGVAALLDGGDRLDPEGVLRLAKLYLAVGFGAEAAQIADLAGSERVDVSIVAAALDGTAYPPGTAIDPACGASSAILALLDPAGSKDWLRADEDAIAPFLDRMHPSTLTNLLPRLEQRLATLGRGPILASLAPVDPHVVDEARQVAAAAGTDELAITSAIALLERTNGRLETAQEAHLVNAMALLPSVPQGILRNGLEQSISSALVLSDRPAEAATLVVEEMADADALLALAIDALPPEAVAEFAVRLRPYLVPDGEAARRAGDLFRSFGLDDVAGQFDPATSTGPAPVEPAGPLSNPWLSRDLASMIGTAPEGWTARNRLAEDILSRSAATPPQMDLAAAEAALRDSRKLSAIVAELVGTGGVRVTGR